MFSVGCYKTRNGKGNEIKWLWVYSFYTLQLLLYCFTLKGGSEGWLVEPEPYYIRPHTSIYPSKQ